MMGATEEAFPLSWPAGVPRARYPQDSQFTQTVASARKGLEAELGRMGARQIVISTNVGPLKADGTPYAKAKLNPSDTGVAVYFERKGKRLCFACDKWRKVSDNLHAVAKTIEALRGIERWGSAEMVEAAFTGFAALPPPAAPPPKRRWWEVLGCFENSTEAVVEGRYRTLAKTYGPDMPQEDNVKMVEINLARDEWRGRA